MGEILLRNPASCYIEEVNGRDRIARIDKIDIDSEKYPRRLREIQNPPKQLYYSGDISIADRDCVAVVGSRKNTVYGKNVAMMIGRRLAESGVPVVSGLAAGIDGFSHEGALDAGGRVIGVLGSGILKMGPPRNKPLMMRAIRTGGVVLSEYEPYTDGRPFTFPARNRIISGLSASVIVVEAGLRSGSLITAHLAGEQGRTVYAVPGNINSQASIGCNLLIRDGAVPLVVIDDIIRDLGISIQPEKAVEASLDEDEAKVFAVISRYDGVTPDRVAQETGMRSALVCSVATVLEIKGVIETYSGKLYPAKIPTLS